MNLPLSPLPARRLGYRLVLLSVAGAPTQLPAIFVTDSNCGPLVIPEPQLKN